MSKTGHNIQDKMTRLSELLAWFDSDNFELEEAVERFHQAEELANEIEQDLAGIKNKVTVISKRFDQESK